VEDHHAALSTCNSHHIPDLTHLPTQTICLSHVSQPHPELSPRRTPSEWSTPIINSARRTAHHTVSPIQNAPSDQLKARIRTPNSIYWILHLSRHIRAPRDSAFSIPFIGFGGRVAQTQINSDPQFHLTDSLLVSVLLSPPSAGWGCLISKSVFEFVCRFGAGRRG